MTYTTSDELLDEHNEVEKKKIAAADAADARRHDRFMGVLGSITRAVMLLGGLTAVSIFGGPYALQGCTYASDKFEAASRFEAEAKRDTELALSREREAKAHAAALTDHARQEQQHRDEVERLAREAKAAGERNADDARRGMYVENCVKTLGLAACEEVQNRVLLDVWGSQLSAEQIGVNVDKLLRDRGLVRGARSETFACPKPSPAPLVTVVR